MEKSNDKKTLFARLILFDENKHTLLNNQYDEAEFFGDTIMKVVGEEKLHLGKKTKTGFTRLLLLKDGKKTHYHLLLDKQYDGVEFFSNTIMKSYMFGEIKTGYAISLLLENENKRSTICFFITLYPEDSLVPPTYHSTLRLSKDHILKHIGTSVLSA